MCGICGAISQKKINIVAMVDSINHRGPDSQNYKKPDKDVFLGHTRLSILDLSDSANQPMETKNGRYTIVYNGEVYNFQNIRTKLISLGKVFKTSSDTEVILVGYETWGLEILKKLNGMFALAVYDKQNKEIIIARDRFGIKPLYYYYQNNTLVFGSEIKALFASEIITKEIDFQGIHEYLYYSTTLGGSTCYRNIKKLLPGHYIKFSKKNFTIKKYISIYDVKQTNIDSFEKAKFKVCNLLENAVKRQLISDVPVGLFLSGGIDSSAIVAFASKHYPEKIKTFSAGFDFDNGRNEFPMAKYIAKHFGTEHHEICIKGQNIPKIIEKLISAHDQPFGDAANIPLYLLSDKIKGAVKVVLQGDGGDEIFAGYNRYNRLAMNKYFNFLSHCFPLLDRIYDLKPYCSIRNLHWLYALYQNNEAKKYAWIMSQESYKMLPEVFFSSEIKQKFLGTNPFSCYIELYKKLKNLDEVQRALYTDCSTILSDLYFEKVDKATMASSLEVRVPFLDNQLAKYVMSLPSNYKVKKGVKKYLLKKALRGIVPDKVLDSPKKGFGVPFQNWLRGPLSNYMKDILLDNNLASSNIFDINILSLKIEEHISGKYNHGFILYKLLNLAIWYNKNF